MSEAVKKGWISDRPEPRVRQRRVDATTERKARDEMGLTKIQARVLAGRLAVPEHQSLEPIVSPTLRHLSDPTGLPDIETGARRLVEAVRAGETIALVCDHDVDGVTSMAVLYRGIVDVLGGDPACLVPFIGHRLKEGYGLSDALVDRMLEDTSPSLVVTADHGSADEPRIRRLAEQGIETIVTDHHAIPEDGIPASAVACITPTREDSRYGDPAIAGCMVAWLLIAQAGRMLDLDEESMKQTRQARDRLLDFVALGTVADCVSLGESVNNRAVVRAGLRRMNEAEPRPCWAVARERLAQGQRDLDEQSLAFDIGPRINARGRLDEAMAGVRFLLSGNDRTATKWWDAIEEENENRKAIERDLKVTALEQASERYAEGAAGLAIWLSEGHPGVHGIVASRVVEAFGRPTVCLSPVYGDPDRITGSARGIPGIHIKRVMDAVATAVPGMLLKHGGHQGAGGLTLYRKDLSRFQQLWDTACQTQAEAVGVRMDPVIWVDGELHRPSLETVEELRAIAPFGRGFEGALFTMEAKLYELKAVGDQTHFQVTLQGSNGLFRGIWFNAVSIEEAGVPPVSEGKRYQWIYSPKINYFRGEERLQLFVRHADPAY
ncbi:DHH family phosphoesterase [Thioalkalivibrio sp. ALE23]|uniref:single-stranded-DNA-specific exonuclease RecJ n=1 Tax=Thioalkalivibrio sp. ALE23 TaxID=1265495 RepID=UPI00035ED6AC|nr:DHH family phosphoesterase [Thioalkalivibrio sp. ALE23]